MNECLKLGSGEVRANVRVWVLAEARRLAGVDQITTFVADGANVQV